MILWTIQPLAVWETIREEGEATVEPARWCLPDYTPRAYTWLRAQLAGRLPDARGGFPWWCHCAKPDLRYFRHGSRRDGQHQVRLELEVDPARVAVFRIWAWDTVFRGVYLGTHRQQREWRSRRHRADIPFDLWDCDLDEPWKAELERSWERIFNPLPARRCWISKHSHEAIIETLRLADVVRATPFRMQYESTEAHLSALERRREAERARLSSAKTARTAAVGLTT